MSALSELYGQPPMQVYANTPGISLITVRHALRELVAKGEVRYEGEDMHRLYFKVVKVYA
jgi:hypothetical protein